MPQRMAACSIIVCTYLVPTTAKENQAYCSKLVRSSQGDADGDREGGPA
jgi:hypothetical protein